jgi:hypothetical protein
VPKPTGNAPRGEGKDRYHPNDPDEDQGIGDNEVQIIRRGDVTWEYAGPRCKLGRDGICWGRGDGIMGKSPSGRDFDGILDSGRAGKGDQTLDMKSPSQVTEEASKRGFR